MTPFPINYGWSPDYDTRLDNSSLTGWFVGESGFLYSAPQFTLKNKAEQALALLESDNGVSFIVEKGQLVEIHKDGTRVVRVDIKTGTLPVRMAENKAGEIFIVNGNEAYLFDKNTNILKQLGSSSGHFVLENPVDVVVINTIAVIVGGTDKAFSYSNPNNGSEWDSSSISTDQATGKLTGVSALNNALYIFGESQVQRWVASIERTSYDAPFSKDTSYTNEYGCEATSSIISVTNILYYLSSNGHVVMESGAGALPITNTGQARYIKEKIVPLSARGAYLEYLGHYFYGLNLGQKNIESTLLYCLGSKKWSFIDDGIIDGQSGDTVLMKDGVYTASELSTSRKNELITKTLYQRQTINKVVLKVVQGENIAEDKRFVELSYSNNNLSFQNTDDEPLGAPGFYQYDLHWDMNINESQFTFKFGYYGDAPLTIVGCELKAK